MAIVVFHRAMVCLSISFLLIDTSFLFSVTGNYITKRDTATHIISPIFIETKLLSVHFSVFR